MACEATPQAPKRTAGTGPEPDVDLDQIVERLSWTPRQRLQYLLDMLVFEDKAHRAKPVEN